MIKNKIIIFPLLAITFFLSGCDELKRYQSVFDLGSNELKNLLINDIDLPEFRKTNDSNFNLTSKSTKEFLVRVADYTCGKDIFFSGESLQSSDGGIVIYSISEPICRNKEIMKKHVLSEKRLIETENNFISKMKDFSNQLGGNFENLQIQEIKDHQFGENVIFFKTSVDILYKGTTNEHSIYTFYILNDKASLTVAFETFNGDDNKIFNEIISKTVNLGIKKLDLLFK